MTSVSFHSNCEILTAFSSGLETDCSCCEFGFMRSGPNPGTLCFIFHGFDVILFLSFCSKKKKQKNTDYEFVVLYGLRLRLIAC